MSARKNRELLRRADFTAAPIPVLMTGTEWQRRPMPLWREVLDALACLARRLGPQRLTPLPTEKKEIADATAAA